MSPLEAIYIPPQCGRNKQYGPPYPVECQPAQHSNKLEVATSVPDEDAGHDDRGSAQFSGHPHLRRSMRHSKLTFEN